VTAAQSATSPTPIDDATTVHTGEPWAGSTPYVLIVLALGLSLLGLGGEIRRRRTSQAPSA
jgi:MYXO-CTERM domain-containing protein